MDSLTGGDATNTRDPELSPPTNDGAGTGIVLQVVVDAAPNAVVSKG